MTCKSCGRETVDEFPAEVAIHFPGLTGLDKPIIWVFPELIVCLSCGNAEFAIPEDKLRLLAKGDDDASAAAAG